MINEDMEVENNKNVINITENSSEEAVANKLLPVSDDTNEGFEKDLINHEGPNTVSTFEVVTDTGFNCNTHNENLESEDIVPTRYKRRTCVIQDSDSENEIVEKDLTINHKNVASTSNSDIEDDIIATESNTEIDANDQDNSEAVILGENESQSPENNVKKKHKRLMVVDSDNDSDIEKNDECKEKSANVEAPIYTTNSRGDIMIENSTDTTGNEVSVVVTIKKILFGIVGSA